MPTAEQILDGLGTIANDWRVLAAFWHGYLAGLLILLLPRLRRGERTYRLALALPAASVALLAWVHGNFFNGAVFSLLAVALLATALRPSRERIRVSPKWPAAAGVLMLAFGWAYPHFLEPGGLMAYLVAAPVGLVPCPTLSSLIGFTLLLHGLGSKGWCALLAGAGLFYGAYGAWILSVRLDIVLLAGALVLIHAAFLTPWVGAGSESDRGQE